MHLNSKHNFLTYQKKFATECLLLYSVTVPDTCTKISSRQSFTVSFLHIASLGRQTTTAARNFWTVLASPCKSLHKKYPKRCSQHTGSSKQLRPDKLLSGKNPKVLRQTARNTISAAKYAADWRKVGMFIHVFMFLC